MDEWQKDFWTRPSLLEVAPSDRSSAEWAGVPPEVRMTSFFSAGVEDEKLLQALRDLCVQGIREGWQESKFIHHARQVLRELKDRDGKPYFDPKDPSIPARGPERLKWMKDVKNLASEARLQLIFRTQREINFGYSQFLDQFTPMALRAFPAWRFYRRAGAKTRRKDHEDHKGEVRFKTDFEYWMARNNPDFGGFSNPFPPFGFNSWMWTEPISYEDCVKIGLLNDGDEPPMPDHRYDPWLKTIPRTFRERSVKGLDEESRERLRERMEREGGFSVGPEDPQKPDDWSVVPPKKPEPQETEEERLNRLRAEREERLRKMKEEQEVRVKKLREEQEERVRKMREERERRREAEQADNDHTQPEKGRESGEPPAKTTTDDRVAEILRRAEERAKKILERAQKRADEMTPFFEEEAKRILADIERAQKKDD